MKRWRLKIGLALGLLALLAGLVPRISGSATAGNPSLPADLTTSNHPFHRVLVFSGGGLQTAVFLGYLDGLEARGWSPDLIIGTCGGAIASLLVEGIAQPPARIALVRSAEFYRLLGELRVNQEKAASPQFRKYFAQVVWQNLSAAPYLPLPAIFEPSDALLWVPPRLDIPASSKPFTQGQQRAIVIGSHLLFSPSEVGTSPSDPARRYYREIYFTDPSTETWLQGRVSDIAREFPNSGVDARTETATDWDLGSAARASIADLRYIQPIRHDGQTYAGGYINLIPLELALELGDEVVLNRPNSFSYLESLANRSTVGFDGNSRSDYARDLGDRLPERVHWIATPDLDELYDKNGLNPRLTVRWTSRMESRIPTDYDEYVRRIDALYAYGRSKATALNLEH